MKVDDYALAWTKKDSLEILNRRIHDGFSLDQDLYRRAFFYHKTAFLDLFPSAKPKPSSRVLEIGGGVGWPIQAGIDLFPNVTFTDLDISLNMIEKAKERISKLPDSSNKYMPHCQFAHYESGSDFPFEDNTFDTIYSYAVLWHLPIPQLVILLDQIKRVLKPGGSFVANFLSVSGMDREYFLEEQKEQINSERNPGRHFLFWHTAMQIHYWVVDVLRCTQFDFKYTSRHFNDSPAHYYWLHFSKEEGPVMLNEKLGALLESINNEIVV